MQNSVYEEKKHFNIIDVMIIIGILLIVIGIIFRAQIIGIFIDNGKQTSYTVSFEADSVPNNVAEKILEQNKVTWVEKSASLGNIFEIEKKPAIIYVPNIVGSVLNHPYKDGTYSKIESDDYKTITGKFTAQGNSNDGCYINGTQFLAAGMTITLATSTTEFEVIITSITENP